MGTLFDELGLSGFGEPTSGVPAHPHAPSLRDIHPVEGIADPGAVDEAGVPLWAREGSGYAAPEGRGATAQGYFSIAQGITLSFCMLLAGFLYERVGAMSYLAMAVVALCGGLIAGIVWLRARG